LLDQAAKEQNIHRTMPIVEVNHQDLQALKLTVAAPAEHIRVMVQIMHTVFHHHGVQAAQPVQADQEAVPHIHIQAGMVTEYQDKDILAVTHLVLIHMRVVVVVALVALAQTVHLHRSGQAVLD
jgi:hypothetical protein